MINKYNQPLSVGPALIFDIGGVLFNPRPEEPTLYEPITPGIDLLKRCYAVNNDRGMRAYRFFILSNAREKQLQSLVAQFPALLSLFDGIVSAGAVGTAKPDRKIYDHLLTHYQLDPALCIFIDDDGDNIGAARSLGMTGIECFDFGHVERTLKSLGIF